MTAAPAPLPANRLALWVRATRPQYLPTSLAPALAGALVAIGVDGADWWLLPVALVALLLIHAATDVCNDVEDAARGIDAPDKINNSRVFTTGALSLREGRVLYGVLFAGAFLLGLLMCLAQTWALLIYGVLGILGGWLYTGGPRPYKYDGLGDAAIVWLMGPLTTQGAYTAVTGDAFHAPAFWVGVIPGLLINAVLEANNLSDIEGDRAAGVHTIAVRLGFRRARTLYTANLAGGAVAPLVLWGAGLFGPWILLPLVLVPMALARAQQARAAAGSDDPVLVPLVPQTAQLHILACVLLCAGVVLDRL